MKIRWNKGVLAFTVLLSVASMIGAVAYSRSFQQKKTYFEPARVQEAPLSWCRRCPAFRKRRSD